jgi:hypothetical protein
MVVWLLAGGARGGTPCGSSKPRPHERRLQEWSGQLEASTDDTDHVRVFFASGTVFLATVMSGRRDLARMRF